MFSPWFGKKLWHFSTHKQIGHLLTTITLQHTTFELQPTVAKRAPTTQSHLAQSHCFPFVGIGKVEMLQPPY